MKQIKRQIE